MLFSKTRHYNIQIFLCLFCQCFYVIIFLKYELHVCIGSSQCSTTGVTKAVVCVILSVG